jgi:kynurenine 3-monooxygenase
MVKCYPWKLNNFALIGDAAHSILPFLGEGTNSGFDDCYYLDQLLEENNEDLGKSMEEL